jgi:hypothetical protein
VMGAVGKARWLSAGLKNLADFFLKSLKFGGIGRF